MSVHRQENGKWAVSFYYDEWNGERIRHRKTGFRTKKEAQEYERKFLENKSGTPKMAFNELVELYLVDCKGRLLASTYMTKSTIINTKILPFFKNVPVDSITPAMIRRWQTEMIQSGLYSKTYLKQMHTQLSAILRYAMKYYGLKDNPALQCGTMGKPNADAMQFWTMDEFNTFVETLRDKPHGYVMFHLLFWTGMRSGELLALTLNDFDFDVNTVSITKSYNRLHKQDIIGEPKTPKSRRIVAVPHRIMDMVANYAKLLPHYQPEDRLFPFTRHTLIGQLEAGCAASGVKKIRVHDLRHSHASLLIEIGASPLLIAERLGHDSIQTTLETYSHLYPNKQDNLAEQLNHMIP